MEKAEKRKLAFRIFWIILILYVGYTVIQQQIHLHELRVQQEEIAAEIKQEKEENQELKNILKIMDTDEYIEKIARQKLGLVKPDEQVFVDNASK